VALTEGRLARSTRLNVIVALQDTSRCFNFSRRGVAVADDQKEPGGRPESVIDAKRWIEVWTEAIRRTEEEITKLRQQGFTSEDERILFRQKMIEHMKEKL